MKFFNINFYYKIIFKVIQILIFGDIKNRNIGNSNVQNNSFFFINYKY